MKNQTYENLIDGTITFMKLSFWTILLSILGMAFFSIIYIVIAPAFTSTPITLPSLLGIVMVPTIMFVVPASIWGFYYQRADRTFEGCRYRDFWIGYSTKIPVGLSHTLQTQMKVWCEENSRHMFKIICTKKEGCAKFCFASKADAMAFKLRWAEEDGAIQ